MNTVINKLSENGSGPLQGDIYKDPRDGELYMLCCIKAGGFLAMSLSDGNRWNEVTDRNGAVDRLVFVSRGATITVS